MSLRPAATTVRAPQSHVLRPRAARETIRNAVRAVLATSVVGALIAGQTPAHAQSGGLDAEQLLGASSELITPGSLNQLVGLGNLPGSSGSSMVGLAGSVGLSPDLVVEDVPLPPQPDPSITETEVVGEPVVDGRYEQWRINSHRMQREIVVEVHRAPEGTGPAPTLYLLDGIESELPSGFVREGAREWFADQNVNLVIPTGGQGSLWADWDQQDPNLGIVQWESFLVHDLPELLEPQLDSNDKRGAGGISMGASAALTLATRHPGFYDAVFGVSGCYSPVGIGETLARYTVQTGGGNPDNMWGPSGSPQWRAHDALANAENLRGTAIHLSSATGMASQEDWENTGRRAGRLIVGMAIEQATGQCTQAAAERFEQLDIPADVVIHPTGLHSWSRFGPAIQQAWLAVEDALQ